MAGGMIALVAGATRGGGRGIAVGLGEAGHTVYVTGRSTRAQRSEIDRPETIEETAELVTQAGGEGIAVRVDHLDPAQVERLVGRIGRLDILVNDIWGGERLFEFDKAIWEHDLANGLRLLRLALDTPLITSHFMLPLLAPGGLVVEVTDGSADYNATRYRVNAFYDLVKNATIRLAWALAQELGDRATAVALSPGWMRSEEMLEHFGVREDNWRDATERIPHFGISETPRFVGRAVAALAADPDRARHNGASLSSGGLAQARRRAPPPPARHNGASLSSGGLAQEYGFTDLDGSRPDCWRYMVEVQDTGRAADATRYPLARNAQPARLAPRRLAPVDDRDLELRNATYGLFAGSGRAPSAAEVAGAAAGTGDEV